MTAGAPFVSITARIQLPTGVAVMRASFFLYLRLLFAWGLVYLALIILFAAMTRGSPPEELAFVGIGMVVIVLITTSTHIRRVRLMVDRVDSAALATWHRRQIEMPFDSGEAFDMMDAAIRELPRVENVESTHDSLQIRAKVLRDAPQGGIPLLSRMRQRARNHISVTITPREGTSSIALVCEPEDRVWRDWLFLDDGSNLANANALTRALSRRIDERRRLEAMAVRSTATEKELAVARLGLLQAQVEPHFLYNTLGSAKYLIKSDPVKAEAMIDNLIGYLRRSLPRAEDSLSTLGEELARVRGYLEILQFRMGARLATHIDVPDTLNSTPLPTMILQMLVENAIKHGLEPKSGGGNIWLLARPSEGSVAITVADDGMGFGPGADRPGSAPTKGTGIGLNNIRERLKLAFGDGAQFNIVSNFPSGVAATLSVPAALIVKPAEKA